MNDILKEGVRVRFLNTTGGGIVRRILRSSGVVYVEDESGFEIPVLLNEVVPVEEGATIVPKPRPNESLEATLGRRDAVAPKEEPKPTYRPAPKRGTDPARELLNVTLCYLPEEGGKIGQCHYELYLVNDSNYDLSVVYTSGKAGAQEIRYQGIIPFDSSELLEHFSPDDLPERLHSTFQILAFKEEGVPYRPKPAFSIDLKVDGAKFFRENAFRATPYFDDPALSYEIIKEDKPMEKHRIDPEKLASEMMQHKVDMDIKTSRQMRQKPQSRATADEPLVVDLHIHELVDTTLGMEPRDMLDLQLKKVGDVLRAHRKPSYKGMKIIFIHGKGEGVLRQAVLDLLKRQYPTYDVRDASFMEYGFGASQVTIR